MVQLDRVVSQGLLAMMPVPLLLLHDTQLDRLALVYIAASVRRGKWLIPPFMSVSISELATTMTLRISI
jgi:hypothetical protein